MSTGPVNCPLCGSLLFAYGFRFTTSAPRWAFTVPGPAAPEPLPAPLARAGALAAAAGAAPAAAPMSAPAAALVPLFLPLPFAIFYLPDQFGAGYSLLVRTYE